MSSNFELLWACYLSGQISEEQWQQHNQNNDLLKALWDLQNPPTIDKKSWENAENWEGSELSPFVRKGS